MVGAVGEEEVQEQQDEESSRLEERAAEIVDIWFRKDANKDTEDTEAGNIPGVLEVRYLGVVEGECNDTELAKCKRNGGGATESLAGEFLGEVVV